MNARAALLVVLAAVLLVLTAALTAGTALVPQLDQVVPLPLPLVDPAAEVLTRENDLRLAQGLGRLARNVQLETAARNYCVEMAYGRFFAHESPSGGQFWQRIRDVGYGDYRWIGEILAAGFPTSTEVVAGWMASPHHREIILARRARETGLGYTRVLGSEYLTYWCQEFGDRGGLSSG